MLHHRGGCWYVCKIETAVNGEFGFVAEAKEGEEGGAAVF